MKRKGREKKFRENALAFSLETLFIDATDRSKITNTKFYSQDI